MSSVDLTMTLAFLGIPPVLILTMRKRWLGFLLAVVWCWGLMVVGGEYHLATDPEYDSITPGLSIVFGWLFGGIYSLPWLMVALVIDLMKRRRGKDEPKAGP